MESKSESELKEEDEEDYAMDSENYSEVSPFLILSNEPLSFGALVVLG